MRPGEVPNHLTADVLAYLYGKTVSNVRRLASVNMWRKVRVGRRMHYHVDDADRDLRK